MTYLLCLDLYPAMRTLLKRRGLDFNLMLPYKNIQGENSFPRDESDSLRVTN